MDYSDMPPFEEETAPLFANVQAERSVLGAAMIDPGAASQLAMLLDESDYFVDSHKWVHESIIALVKAGVDVDMLTLGDELQRRGKLETIGSYAFLASLDAPTSMYVDHYAAIVKRQAWLRRAISVFSKVIQTAYSEQDPDLVFALAQEQLRTLQPQRNAGITMTWEESFTETDKMLEQLGQGSNYRYRWPWETWNAVIDPAEPGLVVEIAGGTGVGKTIYAECLADFWAMKDVSTGILHFELNRHVMLQRRLVRWTGLPLRAVKEQNKTADTWKTIAETQERLRSWTGRIDYGHTAGFNIDQTVLEMERMRDLYGTEIFILDHAKKLHQQASPRQMKLRLSKTEREADNIEQFKTACETLGVRGVILNHFNKTGKAAAGLATMNDIAGAGEQADLVNVIALLDRGTADSVETDPFTGEIVARPGDRSHAVVVKIDKNTMGESDKTFKQWMDLAHFRVMDRRFEDEELSY
jgi:replicative DNA helicase